MISSLTQGFLNRDINRSNYELVDINAKLIFQLQGLDHGDDSYAQDSFRHMVDEIIVRMESPGSSLFDDESPK